MRKHNKNDWEAYNPKVSAMPIGICCHASIDELACVQTNMIWMNYLAEKLVSEKKCKASSAAIIQDIKSFAKRGWCLHSHPLTSRVCDSIIDLLVVALKLKTCLAALEDPLFALL